MPANPSSSQRLYPIDECTDLMADACVCGAQGELVFLSVWARDTAIQEFLARLTLPGDAQGLDQFHLVTGEGASLPVFVGNAEQLEKRTTRAYRRTLFGSMVHLWLFDRRCVQPDRANASALALIPKADTASTERLWTLVRQTCPLPLLGPWRDTVLELLSAHAMLSRLPLALGPLEGHRLALDVPVLIQALGDLIRRGVLRTCAQDALPAEPLRRRA